MKNPSPHGVVISFALFRTKETPSALPHGSVISYDLFRSRDTLRGVLHFPEEKFRTRRFSIRIPGRFVLTEDARLVDDGTPPMGLSFGFEDKLREDAHSLRRNNIC